MKGRTIVSLVSLLVGWLLGIATALAVPELCYQTKRSATAGQSCVWTMTQA